MKLLICRLFGHDPLYLFEMVRCCCIPECIATSRRERGVMCRRCEATLKTQHHMSWCRYDRGQDCDCTR